MIVSTQPIFISSDSTQVFAMLIICLEGPSCCHGLDWYSLPMWSAPKTKHKCFHPSYSKHTHQRQEISINDAVRVSLSTRFNDCLQAKTNDVTSCAFRW